MVETTGTQAIDTEARQDMINLSLPKGVGKGPRITVIGIGGAGGNAINNMIASGLWGVEYVAANTDAQALETSSAERRIQLGRALTEGLGAGSKPEIGEAAAEETLEEIRQAVLGSHMVFLAAGMGGGTGTGAAAVIAKCARELKILTVAIVTKPFMFEGARRMRAAEAGIEELRKHVDTLIVIPNQNLFRIANERTTFAEAFILADQVLHSGIKCIVDLIVKEGLINLDFADVKTIMSDMGTAMMGTGEASGPRRAIDAAEEAITNPLVDDISLQGARGVLLSIIGGRDMTLYEVDEAASRVRQEVDPDANIIVGATFDDEMGDRIRVAIVASGMRGSGAMYVPGSEMASDAPQPLPPMFSAPPVQSRLPGMPPLPGAAAEPMLRPGSALFSHAPDAFPSTHWTAPGDVMIEDRSAAQPEALGTSDWGRPAPTAPADEAAFTPAPPVETRRGPPRMPSIDEFPVVGQREYRARAATPDDAPAAFEAPPPPASRQGTESRGGLLQRLVGRGRGRDDAAVKAELPGFFDQRRR
jgi:cell division protein FtsZ